MAPVVAAGQEMPSQSALPNETYRLRVENIRYGRVEMSADGGEHYVLVGRVVRPATKKAADKAAKTAGVLVRRSGEGLVFAVAPARTLVLLPEQPPALPVDGPHGRHALPGFSADPSAILTNLPVGQGLFSDLLPPPGTPAYIQFGTSDLSAFPDGYSPGEGDVFVFVVTLPAAKPAAGAPSLTSIQPVQPTLAWKNAATVKRIQELGQAYEAGAVARARAEKRLVVSGILNLRARLPAGEPDPVAAVIYLMDGDMIAVQNLAPYEYAVDTHRFADGEHVVEIRAVSGHSSLISKSRALIVVQNGTKSG
ncbi:MAG TPA: hypothetical protein VKT32_17480 [Chthonomonadaceae bacterium]|nr:hypothetical protein [Chthonomonadaceae bacterium]